MSLTIERRYRGPCVPVEELEFLGRLLKSPAMPYVAVLGGAKVSDKIKVIESLLPRVSTLIVGGAMAYTFLKAQGVEVGKSRVDADKLDVARRALEAADRLGKPVVLPIDHLASTDATGSAPIREVKGMPYVEENVKFHEVVAAFLQRYGLGP